MKPARASLVDSILERALSGPPATIDATAVYKFAQSPFAVWCDKFAPREAEDELDDFTKMLFEQGREHEARVLAAQFPGATHVSYDTEEEGFRLVVEDMAAGARAIHGAPLLYRPEGLRGKVDILERRDDGPSIFGRYHYVVKEIKLAKNIADHHRFQAAFYHHILSRLQGFTPASYHVVNRDHEETTFAYDEAEILAAIRGIRSIHDGFRPDAVYGSGLYPWETFTDRCAIDARDVSLVGGVGPTQRENLVANGIATVEQLARAPRETLTALRGVGDKTAAKLQRNAEALVRGTHIPLAPVSFPSVKTEIFLDLEGTGAQTTSDGLVEMDYLIGAIVREGGKERYESFLAESVEDEGRMFRAFVDWLATQDDYVLYHWHHYEVTHFKKLAARYGLDPTMHTRLFGAMRDLFRDATGAFAFPTYSQSIKKIAPYAGFEWRQKDVNAMASIALYFEYARDPAANRDALQKVLDYNEDDCIAMRVVKDWLVLNSA